jgi:D-alanine-D-alanine ligase
VIASRTHRIAVITGDPSLPDPTKREASYHEEDELTHRAMMEAFQSLEGYGFEFWSEHERLLDLLRDQRPDLVVNFCDTGFRNVPIQELNLPAYLELLGIPYTGAPPAAMILCYDKAIMHLVAQSLGVPVPREAYIPADMPLEAVPDLLPALIKPNAADGSVGITKDAVVRTRKEALGYLEWLRATLPGRDALMQEYLSGAEYKAIPDSPYWTEIKFKRAQLAPGLEARLETWARTLFKRLGLRDYGRFDFRVAADGEPKLMEVNPNPAWANDGKLAFMAGFAGIEYRDMLRLILEAAIARLSLGAA